MKSLVVSAAVFRALVNTSTSSPDRIGSSCVGVNRLPGRIEFLVRSISWLGADVDNCGTGVVFRATRRPHAVADLVRGTVPMPFVTNTIVVGLGIGEAAGLVTGACFSDAGVESLDEIRIIDSGLPTIGLITPTAFETTSSPAHDRGRRAHIWSRTIGALGETAWDKLTSLRFAVVGCGRSGSVVATALSRLGVKRFTLIDPDLLEIHNIGEMDNVGIHQVGITKADALAACLAQEAQAAIAEKPRVASLAESVTSRSSLNSIKGSDVLICCVDNASARLACSFFAKLYLKPLLDIGSAVLRDLDGILKHKVGADIRFLLPDRCILCLGGIGEVRTQTNAIRHNGASNQWQLERAGSLRSINQAAVGLGFRLLEEFVGGRLQSSVWLQMDTSDEGIPLLNQPTVDARSYCPLCRLRGRGDAGLHLFRPFIKDTL